MGIWRNIGKIVILLFQIVHEQVKWTIGSLKRDTTKKSNTPSSELNNIQHRKTDNGIHQPSTKRMVELCEQPFYDIKPE